LVSGPAHAAAFTLNSDGSFSYTPAPHYFGPDNFTYRANDGLTNSAPATVSLNVMPANNAPVAVNDSYSMFQNTTCAAPAVGQMSNDSDADSNPLTAVLVSGPTHAAAFTMNPDGSFTYMPVPNYVGPDSFTYRASDGLANSAPAMVSLNVTPVNTPPTIISPAPITLECRPRRKDDCRDNKKDDCRDNNKDDCRDNKKEDFRDKKKDDHG